MQKSEFDWQYYTEPSNYSSLGLNGGQAYWPRGKILGGCSQINAMIYLRGNRRDYDTWELKGNSGWGWDTVLEYFKKSEDNTEEKYAMDKQHHSTGGLLKVGSFGSNEPTKKIFKEAFNEMGFKEILASYAKEYLGYFDVQGTVYGGERYEVAKGFLASAKGRKNLNIIKNAHVSKLRFAADGSVNGVIFVVDNKTIIARSRKEVVLSAGSVGSPQILMLSGIGPRSKLEKLKIPIQNNLPVGLNLQDHFLIPFGMAFDKSNSTPYTTLDTAEQMYEFNVHRKGPLTNIGATDVSLFMSTVNDKQFPDIQIIPISFKRQHPGLRLTLGTYNLRDDIIESFIKANQEANLVVWCVILLLPKSIGYIDLASKSPFDGPMIYPNYLSERKDVDVIVKAMQKVFQISETKVFCKHEVQVVRVSLPACDKFKYKSDLYWECYVRHMTVPASHPVGTCKMGRLNESSTVVDNELKVKGVKGLRVADASIMPQQVSGNTNAPTIMIGEMAADFMKSDWL